jgi:hypothetical protein
MNDGLRSAVAATLTPVRPLRSPAGRTLAVVPLAALLLVAAPLYFDFRDLAALGWLWSWGASLAQGVAGLTLIAFALREAVPGRRVGDVATSALIVGAMLLFAVVTSGAWHASPLGIRQHWLEVAAICLTMSAATSLPAVALTSVLIVRAFPLRPGLAGTMAGFGSGLLADAGWRLFCHYSAPDHVIAAHLGAVVVAALTGAALARWLSDRSR